MPPLLMIRDMDEWMQTPAKDIYLAEMGWHFNEKACNYAVQYLKDRNNKPIKPYSKEEVDEMLKKQSVTLEKNKGWDYVYVANMAKSDMDGSPLADDKSIANYVKIVIDDADAADGEVMGCWYTKMIFRRIPVDWAMFL
jgi:hypothetical protein